MQASSMQFPGKSRSLRAACERGWAWEKGVDGCPGFRESGKKEPRKPSDKQEKREPGSHEQDRDQQDRDQQAWDPEGYP